MLKTSTRQQEFYFSEKWRLLYTVSSQTYFIKALDPGQKQFFVCSQSSGEGMAFNLFIVGGATGTEIDEWAVTLFPSPDDTTRSAEILTRQNALFR